MRKSVLFSVVAACGVILLAGCAKDKGGNEPAPVKTVAVGAQNGALTAGTAGTATFAVTTANIPNGNYTATVANLPTGVSVQEQVAVNNNAGTLTLAANTSTTAGETAALTLTLDGATSAPFKVTINSVKVTAIALNHASATLAAGATLQLSIESIAPDNAADPSVKWDTTDAAVASVNNAGLVTIADSAADGATAGITATANDGSETTTACAITVEYALINSIYWAKRNVDAVGTFAATPQDAGMFYQWNIKTAWAATGDVTNWNTNGASESEWVAANDPCPAGWRVPTKTELDKLLDGGKVTKTLSADPVGRTFAGKTSGDGSIFLLAAGSRFYTDGKLTNAGSAGNYWSSTENKGTTAWYLNCFGILVELSDYYRTFGLPVRCVRQ